MVAKSFMLYIVGKPSAPESQDFSNYLCHVKRHDAMAPNKFVILYLFWASTSEPI